MVVGLYPKFTREKIIRGLTMKLNNLMEALIMQAEYIGETFVTLARDNGAYTDRTGNLRNSIGYLIMLDGKVVRDNFQRASQKAGEDGVKTGRAVAERVAKQFPKGIVLICVAGMNYAAAVESKGFDVITSSELECVGYLKDAIKFIQSEL
jgi:hypothetical protein